MIIGITGKKFNGKDTVSDYIVSKYNFTKIAYAEPLKEVCRNLFNFNDEQLYGDKKEDLDSFWNITPRQAFQFIGTDMIRNNMDKMIKGVNNNFWVKCLEKRIINLNSRGIKNIIVSDIRFNNEADLIKRLNGKLIKVSRNIVNNDSHISELEIDNIEEDILIENKGSLEELYSKIDTYLSSIGNEL
jgi:dephospho-CoA kinase